MKNLNRLAIPFMLMLLAVIFDSCSVIGGIFKAGMGFGIFIVVAVIILIVVVVLQATKNK